MNKNEKPTKPTLIKEGIVRQHCPTCNRYVKMSTRYPNYACAKCQEQAINENGDKVQYFNTTDDGHGCQGMIRETKELTHSNICFIKSIKFKVDQAYLGGVVFLPDQKRKRMPKSEQI